MVKNLYSVTLENGVAIDNLIMNGNNFISKVPVTEELFDGNLGTVTISDGSKEEVHKNMDLVQITEKDNEWWFVLRDMSNDELERAKLRSDLDYLWMMSNIEV